MSDDTHVLESLPGYAIGSLDEAEAQLVAEHIAGCVICRQEWKAFQAIAEQFASLLPDASPPPELRERLIDQVERLGQRPSLPSPRVAQPTKRKPEARRSWRPSLSFGGIVGLFLIAVLAVSNLFLWQRFQHLELITGSNGMRAIALQSSDGAPRASAFIVIGADGLNGVLVVDQMPPLEASKEYQLWLVRDGENTSAAVFPVDQSGYRGVRVKAPESLLLYSSVHVTIEPAGGSVSPTGEDVLRGSLFNP